MRPTLVLYHASCMDGFAAACAVAAHRDEAECRPVRYGDPVPEDVAGRAVWVVDFSWPVDEMRGLLDAAVAVTWIDHHVTSTGAYAALRDHPKLTPWSRHDVSECGATLTWMAVAKMMARLADHLPAVLQYVRDRDLWQWRLARSREVSAALALYWRPRWAHVAKKPAERFLATSVDDIVRLGDLGELLLGDQRERVVRAFARAELRQVAGWGVVVATVNAHADVSEIGEALYERYGGVACTWYHDPTAKKPWIHSLRSRELDVAVLAQRHGGGGHPQAAGFTADRPIIDWSEAVPKKRADGTIEPDAVKEGR